MYGSLPESSQLDSKLHYQNVNEKHLQKVQSQNVWIRLALLIGSVIGAFGILFMLSSSRNELRPLPISSFESTTLETYSFSTEELGIKAINEYGQFKGPYPWLDDVSGSQLVEPYKNTTIKLSGTQYQSTNLHIWKITDLDGNVILEDHRGHELTMMFTTPTIYELTIHVYDQKGSDNEQEILGSYTTRLICKFVKRDIRTLTDDDRERFLDAAFTLWQYSTLDGRNKFGPKFTSIQTFVVEHSIASNDIMCDQFHEGSGFLTHHMALQNSFEASMRAVDPSVTLPYWDFTVEGQEIYEKGEKPSHLMEITEVFSDKWFGAVDENHVIKDSRWKNSLMPVASNDEITQNSYGYIRSYWNNNPDKYVTRKLFDACGSEPVHKAIPYCKTHYEVLNTASLGDFQIYSPGDGHGPLHVQIGGMWGGCSDAYANFSAKWSYLLDANMTDDEIEAVGYNPRSFKWGNTAPRRLMFETAVMGEYFHIYRSFWRSHMCALDNTPKMLKCPEKCDVDTVPFEECSCEVTALKTGNTTWENLFPCVLNSETNRDYFDAFFPEEFLEEMTYNLATTSVLEGEMIESASTADIIFWIIHPAIERLLSAKRLTTVSKMGKTDFLKWDVPDGSNETWLEYSYYNLNAGDNQYHPEEYKCVGHAKDDPVLPFSLPFTDAIQAYSDLDGDGTVTNWEFLVSLDPNNVEANDYVFDHFKWDHCDDVDMEKK